MHVEEKRQLEIELRKIEVKYLRGKLHLMEKINEEIIYTKGKIKEAVYFNRRFRHADFWEKYMFKQWRMDITFDAFIDIQTEHFSVIYPLICLGISSIFIISYSFFISPFKNIGIIK